MSTNIISREDCGLRPPNGSPSTMVSTVGLIVHCSAGNQPTSADDGLARWRNVQRYHMDRKGWGDIGYSFGFTDFGQLIEGRGWRIHGAHSGAGWNDHYHGICYLGSGENPTPQALCALHRFICEHDRRCGVGEVIGHRDIANKSCPGQGIYDYLLEHFGDRNPHVDQPRPSCPSCGQDVPTECRL